MTISVALKGRKPMTFLYTSIAFQDSCSASISAASPIGAFALNDVGNESRKNTFCFYFVEKVNLKKALTKRLAKT